MNAAHDPSYALPCGHAFHVYCIKMMLDRGSDGDRVRCPICRKEVEHDAVVEIKEAAAKIDFGDDRAFIDLAEEAPSQNEP